MTSLSSTAAASLPDSPSSRSVWVRWLLISLAAIAVAHLLDETAWRALRKPNIYDSDFGRLLRIQGFLPTWIFGALALWLHEVESPVRRSRALFLLFAPALSGGAAELLKLLFRRLRPDAETFGYAFRAFSDGPFSNRGMGLPSSHAMVAFGGAFAMARLFPRTRWVWYTLAAGCAISRIMANAHYLSDTVVAACVAWAVVALLHARVTAKAS
ncbi:MAG: phosphatase PAP2 family protein [Gemmatimonadaceae bacterium]|nr:phosphatase PAP2 family protein [Gemmatimonadaceae bacterium]